MNYKKSLSCFSHNLLPILEILLVSWEPVDKEFVETWFCHGRGEEFDGDFAGDNFALFDVGLDEVAVLGTGFTLGEGRGTY